MEYPNLVTEMKKRNETRYDLANLLGITYSGMSYKLQGKRTLTIQDIRKLCNHYGKSFEYLFATKKDIEDTMKLFKKLMEG